MSALFKNKYRIESTRLQKWDYKWNAAYFITICTKNRKHYFGDIINGKMKLTEIGEIAQTEWLKTFDMRPDMNITMGDFIIMPDHFHAIIIIGKNKFNSSNIDSTDPMHCASSDPANPSTDAMHCDPADPANPGTDSIHFASSDPANPSTGAIHCASINNHKIKNKFGPQSKNLASVIRGFKIGVTVNARKINCNFGWQPSYHDHIVRNQTEFDRISKYIANNPENWNK
jgi:REP-associated tyrosine transposase